MQLIQSNIEKYVPLLKRYCPRLMPWIIMFYFRHIFYIVGTFHIFIMSYFVIWAVMYDFTNMWCILYNLERRSQECREDSTVYREVSEVKRSKCTFQNSEWAEISHCIIGWLRSLSCLCLCVSGLSWKFSNCKLLNIRWI